MAGQNKTRTNGLPPDDCYESPWRRLDLSAVRGIGLAGHMHGATLLDSGDNVLRPCILWNDTRAADEAPALDSDPQFRDFSGNIVFAGFTAPKVVWVKNNEPETFRQTRQSPAPQRLPAPFADRRARRGDV